MAVSGAQTNPRLTGYAKRPSDSAPALSDGSRVRHTEMIMSSQERNQHALQRLMKYIAPRLYENEPPSESSERALRALSGQLGSNPPYVIDAFELTQTYSDFIQDVAISKTGKVAILLGSHVDEDSYNVFLTTWPRPRGYSELQDLGVVKDDAKVSVLFPEGSDTPAVIVGGQRIEWGNWSLELSMPDHLEVTKDAYLTLWEDSYHLRHVAYLHDGELFYETNAVLYSKLCAKNVRWLGYIYEEPAWITNEIHDGQCETLHWRNVKAIMPCGQRIISESIVVMTGQIQLVTEEDGRMFAHIVSLYNKKNDLISDPMGYCVWGDGYIFGCRHAPGSTPGNLIYEFDQGGQWIPVAELDFPKFRHVEHLFSQGDHFTLVNQGIGGLTLYSGVRGNLRVEATPIARGPKTGFVGAHSGILYQTMVTGTGGFIWSALNNTPGKRPLTATFPCYGKFDQLVPIQDDRGKAIMSWGYAEGTFCVIRYPLPTR